MPVNSGQIPSKNAFFAWHFMTVIVLAEAVAMLALFGFTVMGFLNRGEDPLLAALSIVIVAAVAAFWVGLTAIALLRRRSWARGSTLTIQILAMSVAIGAFQGIYARVDIGWLIAIPAIAAFIAAIIARPPARPPVSSARPEA